MIGEGVTCIIKITRHQWMNGAKPSGTEQIRDRVEGAGVKTSPLNCIRARFNIVMSKREESHCGKGREMVWSMSIPRTTIACRSLVEAPAELL